VSKHSLIEPLSSATLQQLDDNIGPPEHTPEATVLETNMGFSYHSVLVSLSTLTQSAVWILVTP
jgi:hypothetical protein